jgi:hypothetical protein
MKETKPKPKARPAPAQDAIRALGVEAAALSLQALKLSRLAAELATPPRRAA